MFVKKRILFCAVKKNCHYNYYIELVHKMYKTKIAAWNKMENELLEMHNYLNVLL